MKALNNVWIYFMAAFCLILFCSIPVAYGVFPLNQLPLTFIGAAMGAVITGVITVVLLKGQTEAQEIKERNVKIFEKKSQLFQDFIEHVWSVWSNQKITIEEFQNLASQYYQNLMIYIKKEDRLEVIGKCLSKMGECIEKPEKVGDLRSQIITIINELSKELELGGQIDEKIMDEHDKILSPLVFRRELLDKLNRELGAYDPGFDEGKYELIRGDNKEQGWITFGLKGYPGIKLAIQFGDNLKAVFLADPKFKKIGRYKYTNDLFRRMFGPDKDLIKPLPDDEDKTEVLPFNFSEEESMKKFREGGFDNILVRRVLFYVSQWEKEGLDIIKYLEKYYG